MQTDVIQAIVKKVNTLSVEQQEKVLEFVENLEPQRKTLWEMWQKHLKEISQDELDEIPPDASVNLDHYLYGAPKK